MLNHSQCNKYLRISNQAKIGNKNCKIYKIFILSHRFKRFTLGARDQLKKQVSVTSKAKDG